MKRFLPLILLLIVVGGESRGEQLLDYGGLIRNLRAAGVLAEQGESVDQPFLSVQGKIVKVYGENVQVFQYAHEAETDAQAAQVSPDGNTVGTTKIHWVGPPHFFKKGKLLVLYVGDNDEVLGALKSALGRQFAGR